LILSESRYLRYFSFTILYVAQGFPFGLVTVALPAFLLERGTSPAAVGGFVGAAMLPWTFKWLAGPMMERFTFLSMGRRRPWVLLAQLGLALTGLAFAFFPDALDDLVMLTALCFVLNCFGATQDVAVDGMAMDVLPEDEHGRTNAFMAFGQVAGISGAGTISAFVLKSFGMPGISVMLIVGFGLILMWAVLVRERVGEKVLPWTRGQATERSLQLRAESWSVIAVDLARVLFLPASLLLIAVSSLFRFSDALWIQVGQTVVVQQLGYASEVYSSWVSATSFVAALAGIALGFFIDRLGVKRFYLGALLAYGLLATAVGFSASAWESPLFLVTVSSLQALVYYGVFVSFLAVHMKLCGTRVAATQFAIYMGVVNFARSLGATAIGGLQPYLAYDQMFFVVGAGFFLAVVLLWVADLRSHQQRVGNLHASAVTA
jgi:MFS transporter, PAT family, beta-lactamase induction signal transducer AmpG